MIKKITIKELTEIVKKVISESKSSNVKPKLSSWNKELRKVKEDDLKSFVSKKMREAKDMLDGDKVNKKTDSGSNYGKGFGETCALYVKLKNSDDKTIIYDVGGNEFVYKTLDKWDYERDEEDWRNREIDESIEDNDKLSEEQIKDWVEEYGEGNGARRILDHYIRKNINLQGGYFEYRSQNAIQEALPDIIYYLQEKDYDAVNVTAKDAVDTLFYDLGFGDEDYFDDEDDFDDDFEGEGKDNLKDYGPNQLRLFDDED